MPKSFRNPYAVLLISGLVWIGLARWVKTSVVPHAVSTAGPGTHCDEKYRVSPRSDEDYVDFLYCFMFDRYAERSGRLDWLRGLRQGMQRDVVMHEFFRSREFKGRVFKNQGWAKLSPREQAEFLHYFFLSRAPSESETARVMRDQPDKFFASLMHSDEFRKLHPVIH